MTIFPKQPRTKAIEAIPIRELITLAEHFMDVMKHTIPFQEICGAPQQHLSNTDPRSRTPIFGREIPLENHILQHNQETNS